MEGRESLSERKRRAIATPITNKTGCNATALCKVRLLQEIAGTWSKMQLRFRLHVFKTRWKGGGSVLGSSNETLFYYAQEKTLLNLRHLISLRTGSSFRFLLALTARHSRANRRDHLGITRMKSLFTGYIRHPVNSSYSIESGRRVQAHLVV